MVCITLKFKKHKISYSFKLFLVENIKELNIFTFSYSKGEKYAYLNLFKFRQIKYCHFLYHLIILILLVIKGNLYRGISFANYKW